MNLQVAREIETLKRAILALGAVVEDSVLKAGKAVVQRDPVLAEEVIAADFKIDQMEVDLEEDGLKVLALHQPVAIDLRFIVAVLRINSDLERIGDLAVNLAERALFLSSRSPVDVPGQFSEMTARAESMLEKSLDSLVNMNVETARSVIAADDEVDLLNREMYRIIYDLIRRDPDRLECFVHLISAARHIERIADHATNIAEDVVYMNTGEIIRHKPEDFREAKD